MANYEIAHGNNPEMIQLAKSIKGRATGQIQHMQISLDNSESYGKTIAIGQCPQALSYASNAGPAVPLITNLSQVDEYNKSQVIKMKSIGQLMATGMLNFRSVGLTDLVQQDFKKLQPNTVYTLVLTILSSNLTMLTI